MAFVSLSKNPGLASQGAACDSDESGDDDYEQVLRERVARWESHEAVRSLGALAVKSNEYGGVYFVAKKPIKKGDTILMEAPLVATNGDGFCAFCSSCHEDEFSESDSGWVPDNVAPHCPQSESFFRMAAPTLRALQTEKEQEESTSSGSGAFGSGSGGYGRRRRESDGDEGPLFGNFEPLKLRLLLLLLFRLRQKSEAKEPAASSESSSDSKSSASLPPAQLAQDLLSLHYEDECEPTFIREDRLVATKALVTRLLPDAYRSILTAEELVEVAGIIDTNAFSVQVSPDACTGAGIYLVSSLLNHACVPNAAFLFDDRLHMRVIAQADIAPDTPVTISYNDSIRADMDPFERILLITNTLGFRCECDLCHESDDEGIPVTRELRAREGSCF